MNIRMDKLSTDIKKKQRNGQNDTFSAPVVDQHIAEIVESHVTLVMHSRERAKNDEQLKETAS